LTVTVDLQRAGTMGDQKLLERMVWNLVDNAVRHNEPGGWIGVTTGAVSAGAVSTGAVSAGCGPGQVFVRVANSGAAVPTDEVPGILEPFRRLAGRTAAQEGVGLGLSIVRSVGAAHDAKLDVRALDGGGLEVCVTLQSAMCAPEQLPAATAAGHSLPHGGS
ncbi:MAG: ATP-binding protein, partial [Actinobacteria bacterium]|nr:ATP-binding protein [Actinomycetota bacterium]